MGKVAGDRSAVSGLCRGRDWLGDYCCLALAGWFVHRAFSYPDEAHAGSGKQLESRLRAA